MTEMTDYQVFVSHKKTDDEGEDTKEALLAQQIHHVFNSRGVTTFLAEDSVQRRGETEYMKTIDAVLDQVDVLVVVASSEKNINSRWIEYEWQSFVNDILSNRKPKGRIFSYLVGMSVDQLPRPLRLHQSLVHGDGQLERLFQAVATALGLSELNRVTREGEIAVSHFYEMIEVMAESRRLEMEMFSKSGLGQMVMTEDQHQEMWQLIDRLRSLTTKTKANKALDSDA